MLRAARRQVASTVVRAIAPRAQPLSRLRPGPVTVAGILSASSGVGEGARLTLESLRNLGWDVRHQDITPWFTDTDIAEPLPGTAARSDEGGTLILHVNGPAIAYAEYKLGRAFLDGRRIIGYWNWELPRVDWRWRRAIRHVHEVWVPSRFTADALSANARVPVRVVPYSVHPPDAVSSRARFGLPADAFVVFSAFNMASNYARKNPRATIEAFRRAFGDRRDCLLLLKVGNAGVAEWARADLLDALKGMSNVRLMEESLSRAEMAALIASADAVLSLHRSEGFGLLLAEAMMLGVPVVATGWSANAEFMSAEDSIPIGYQLIDVVDPQGAYRIRGARWADPDTKEAAAWLVRLQADQSFRVSLARRARLSAHARWTEQAYRAAIGDALPPPDVIAA